MDTPPKTPGILRILPKRLLTDAGFWIAYYEERDSHHAKAVEVMQFAERNALLVPWPILYETLCTRFVKRKPWAQSFERQLGRANTVRVSDAEYRDFALSECLDLAGTGKRCLSLADAVVRAILQDKRNRVDYLITFNHRDFVDVCITSQIEIFPAV